MSGLCFDKRSRRVGPNGLFSLERCRGKGGAGALAGAKPWNIFIAMVITEIVCEFTAWWVRPN